MNRLWKMFLAGSLLMTGCSPAPKVVTMPPEVITPPSYLLEDCAQSPIKDLKTNLDLVNALKDARTDFEMCNNQVKAIRTWFKKVENEVNKKE